MPCNVAHGGQRRARPSAVTQVRAYTDPQATHGPAGSCATGWSVGVGAALVTG